MTNIAMKGKCLIEIDGLPIKNVWIFPWQTVGHNQRVGAHYFQTNPVGCSPLCYMGLSENRVYSQL